MGGRLGCCSLQPDRFALPRIQFSLYTITKRMIFVVVVGDNGVTRFFIDSRFVGEVAAQYTGVITTVGNSDNPEFAQPFGIVRDLRVYGALADAHVLRRPTHGTSSGSLSAPVF